MLACRSIIDSSRFCGESPRRFSVVTASFRRLGPPTAYLPRRGSRICWRSRTPTSVSLTLEQCRDAVDKSLHAGRRLLGHDSAGRAVLRRLHRTSTSSIPRGRGQDLFVLSKGHAVAALASIYAELGYFDASVLRNSRSYDSILNGHPGPLLPGVHLATGPMGQGFGVAQGFAIAGRTAPRFDSYCLTGDGELQEGPIWEAVMYAGQKHLDNLCVMVDRNNGQLDIANRMVFPMPELERGVRVVRLAGAQRRRHAVRRRLRGARAVPLRAAQRQAHGDHLPRHERARRAVGFPQQAQGHGRRTRCIEQELALQAALRGERVEDFSRFYREPGGSAGAAHALQDALLEHRRGDASRRRRTVRAASSSLRRSIGPVLTTARAAARQDRSRYDAAPAADASIGPRSTPPATS